MKYIIICSVFSFVIFFVFLFSLAGCNPAATVDDNGKKIELGASVITVNECQYVVFRESHPYAGSAIVHAGNCNNPIHNNQ